MTSTEHFDVTADDAVGPQRWMQLRNVATRTIASVSKNYDPSGGGNKNDLLQELELAWTNTSPVSQWVYGLMTKSGSQVTLQCRSRGYIATAHAVDIGTGPPTLNMTEVSRFGTGADTGNGGILNIGGAYSIAELRQNSTTMPFMPHIVEWFLVAPGDTITAKVQTRFISEGWESTQIDGGDGDTESKIITGDVRLDLFAIPSVLRPLPRLIPDIVGWEYDRGVDLGIVDTQTNPAVPDGVEEGDILLAVVCTNIGLAGSVGPVEPGWTRIHDRKGSPLGETDVHMRIYMRTATDAEPTHYHFTNSLLGEQTSVIIALRNAVPQESSYGLGWHIASTVSAWKLVETQKAPSIEDPGQLLLCLSFFAHTPLQAPIHQGAPTGMTLLADLPGAGSSLAIAYLESPPSPTLERKFTRTKVPQFSGHSIAASVLIPGVQTFG